MRALRTPFAVTSVFLYPILSDVAHPLNGVRTSFHIYKGKIEE